MGKGGKGAKGGGKGSKGGGKGGKGGKSDNCLWCDKPGHYKKDCRAFVKWKEDKDEERKKNGQPAYVPPAGRGGPRAPLKSLEEDYTQFQEQLGGMTEFRPLASLEEEYPRCHQCQDEDICPAGRSDQEPLDLRSDYMAFTGEVSNINVVEHNLNHDY